MIQAASLRLLEITKHVELVLQDARSIGERILGIKPPLVSIGCPQLASCNRGSGPRPLLDLVGDFAYRRIQAVDRDQADRGGRPPGGCARLAAI